MTKTWKTWKEKHLAWEENGIDIDDSMGGFEEGEGSGSKAGDEANTQPRKEALEKNLVFVILVEFHAPEPEVAKLAAGAERAVFENPIRSGEHVKPLYIKGHLGGKLVGV
jgi:hypothetical protein